MDALDERARVRRLRERLGFGPGPADAGEGFDQALARLLGAPADDAGARATPPPALAEPTVRAPKTDQQARKRDRAERAEADRLPGVGQWSQRTRDALQPLAGDPTGLLAVAACAPEYVVSG